jgi:DNA-directed RNA polymerase specialized sigma subunit
MPKHNHIVKTLQDTRAEHPIDGDDVEAWVDRLTTLSDELEHIREASDPTLFTERQAEVLVRWHGMGQTAAEIADVLGIGNARVYEIRHITEDKLLAAEATLSVMNELRQSIRPDPHADPADRQ